MKAITFGLAASSLLLTGCVVREIHHVHHTSSRAPGDTDASEGADADAEGGGAAPGAVMADSQPPPPMTEEPLEQPTPGEVWVDGYWHWSGDDWQWVGGNWVAPVEVGAVYIPPSYYTQGSHCLYVPGRWHKRGPSVVRRPPKEKRDRPGRFEPGAPDRPVRDHRTDRGDRKPGRPVRDHRGEEPNAPDVDREVAIDPERAVLQRRRSPRRMPERLPERTPERSSDELPDRDADELRPDGSRVMGSAGRDRIEDRGRDQRTDRAGQIDARDYVIIGPRPRPARRPGGRHGKPGPGVDGPPIMERPAARSPTRWSPPVRSPTRVGPPIGGAPSRVGAPSRSPVRVIAPGRPGRYVGPPVRVNPSPNQARPSAPAGQAQKGAAGAPAPNRARPVGPARAPRAPGGGRR